MSNHLIKIDSLFASLQEPFSPMPKSLTNLTETDWKILLLFIYYFARMFDCFHSPSDILYS